MAKNRSKLKRPAVASEQLLTASLSHRVGSSQNEHPVFCLEFLRPAYCLSKCDVKEKAALADTLHELSRLTWSQIQAAPRHGKGCEKIDRASIKGDSIPLHITDDTHLLAFRFFGKAPMVGYRTDRIFHLVWLDRDFTLYSH